MHYSESGQLRIGRWRVDTEAGTLSSEDETKSLEPKVLHLLLFLIQKPESVFSKDDLIREVWEDAFVSDEVLTSAIWKLRQALEDDPKNPRYIQTLPRRGYRFIGEISRETPPQDPDEVLPRRASRSWIRGFAMPLLCLAALFLVLFLYPTADSQAGRDGTLAVVPFSNASGDHELDYLSTGIAQGIINRLSRVPSLQVISRSSTEILTDPELEPSQISEALGGVETIIQGRLDLVGEEIAVHVEMIDGLSNATIWGERYTQPRAEVFVIEEHFAQKIAEALQVRLQGPDLDSGRGPDVGLAYDFYTKGLHLLDDLADSRPDEVAGIFEKALEVHPHFAPAHLGLAKLYYSTDGIPPDVAREQSRRHAMETLRLDPSSGQAYLILANLSLWFDRDLARAKSYYEKARRLSPSFCSADSGLANWYLVQGRFDEALEAARRVREVDPLALWSEMLIASIHQKAGHTRQALEAYEKVLAEDPATGEAYVGMALAYLQEEETEQARALLKRAWNLSGNELMLRARAAYGFALLGEENRARQVLSELREAESERYVPKVWSAKIHLGLGQIAVTLELLEEAFEKGDPWLMTLAVDPAFERVRNHPRYLRLVKRMGLEGGFSST